MVLHDHTEGALTRACTVWDEWEYIFMRRIWADHQELSPRERAKLVAARLDRPVGGILSKASECGLRTCGSHQAAHGGSVKVTGNMAECYRLKSPEAAWRERWIRVHGRRSYGSKPIRIEG